MRIFVVTLFVAVGLFSNLSPAQIYEQKEAVLATKEVTDVVRNTAQLLDSHYLFEEKSPKLIQTLKAGLKSGEYDGSYTFGRLKQKLEVLLYQHSGDSNFELQRRGGFESPAVTWEQVSGGTIESGTLDQGIGFISLNGDFTFEGAERDLSSALNRIADVKAVVIDLRKAGLGSLSLTQHVLSHFFAAGTPLADVHLPNGKTQHLLSQKHHVASMFRADVPVFVVTSAFVTGPWELLAYTLKHADRAVIVGEKSMGVAVMTISRPVSHHVRLKFSRASMASPGTYENWQEWGVEVDHEAAAEQSFALAVELAAQASTH